MGSREIAASVQPAQRNGKAAALGGGVAHDVSNLPGVGRHLGSQPAANTSITIMRAPQCAVAGEAFFAEGRQS
jgi:hypothetical protein